MHRCFGLCQYCEFQKWANPNSRSTLIAIVSLVAIRFDYGKIWFERTRSDCYSIPAKRVEMVYALSVGLLKRPSYHGYLQLKLVRQAIPTGFRSKLFLLLHLYVSAEDFPIVDYCQTIQAVFFKF